MLEETTPLDACSRYVGDLARSCWIRGTIALHPSPASEFTVFAPATLSSLPLDTGAPKPVRRRGSAWEFYFHLHSHQDLRPMMYWGVSAKAPLLCVRWGKHQAPEIFRLSLDFTSPFLAFSLSPACCFSYLTGFFQVLHLNNQLRPKSLAQGPLLEEPNQRQHMFLFHCCT